MAHVGEGKIIVIQSVDVDMIDERDVLGVPGCWACLGDLEYSVEGKKRKAKLPTIRRFKPEQQCLDIAGLKLHAWAEYASDEDGR